MTRRGLPPPGTVLHPDGSVRRHGSDVLLGGSPLRLLRLSADGAAAFDTWVRRGQPLEHSRSRQRLAARLIDLGIVHPEPPPTATDLTTADVTLVSPVRDDPEGARRLLAASTELAERIVVDDGSRAPLPQAALRHDHPRGPAAARNTGWRASGTELVAFVDADVQLEPGWLDALLAQFADPQVAAVAPRVRSRPGRSRLARYESRHSSLDMGDTAGPVVPMSRISYVPSATIVVRRSALVEIGGFDEQLRYGEDVDLVWRLHRAGHAVRYQPASVVGHEPRPSLSAWLRQRFCYGTSAATLSQRHPGLLCCAKLSRFSAVGWGLLAAGRPRSAMLVMAVTAALFPRKLRGRGVPAREAVRLAALGHVGAGRLLLEATMRTWWPLLLTAAPMSRRARRVLLAAVLVRALGTGGWGELRPVLRVLDDAAYGSGVWAGSLRERTPGPLLPGFTDDTLR